MEIKGVRGDWTALANGERLAVIHTHWRIPPDNYRDPMTGSKLDGKRYQDYVALLRARDKVILQRDRITPNDSALGFRLDRDGYVGVFTFTNLCVEGCGAIGLQLVGRIG